MLGEVLEHGNREDSCAELLCEVGLGLARLVLQGQHLPAPARHFLGLYCAAPENASLVGRGDATGATFRQVGKLGVRGSSCQSPGRRRAERLYRAGQAGGVDGPSGGTLMEGRGEERDPGLKPPAPTPTMRGRL